MLRALPCSTARVPSVVLCPGKKPVFGFEQFYVSWLTLSRNRSVQLSVAACNVSSNSVQPRAFTGCFVPHGKTCQNACDGSKSQRKTRQQHSEPYCVQKSPGLASAMTASRCPVPVQDTTTNRGKNPQRRYTPTDRRTKQAPRSSRSHEDANVHDVVHLSKQQVVYKNEKN